MSESNLRSLLAELDPKARDDLRRVLIRDMADRDVIALELLRYRDGRGDDWADTFDMLTMVLLALAVSEGREPHRD